MVYLTPRQHFDSAWVDYTPHKDKISKQLIRSALSAHHDFISEWIQYSEDKRANPGWFIKPITNKRFEVNCLTQSSKVSHTEEYDDALDACAAFIKHEIDSIVNV